MSQRTLEKRTRIVNDDHFASTTAAPSDPAVGIEHCDIVGILGRMTFAERVRAYENGTFSRRELAAAGAREPDRMPMLHGEFEWIAVKLADLD